MAWNIAALAALLLALAYIGFLHYRAYRRERALARTDDLTRIDNRRAFYENASREFERARRYNHPFTLAYFDADDFQELNDRFGQPVADGVLRLVAETARDAIRASDLVARLGADQFALLLPEAGVDAASAVIRKLQQALRDASQVTGMPLSVSGGVVTCLQPADSLETVIGTADQLLHGAKSTGRDTFWSEVVAPQPLEGFEPARLRRPWRLPPSFDVPMPPQYWQQG
jgi:diguanylate cyclase (GGDEF)-like protein